MYSGMTENQILMSGFGLCQKYVYTTDSHFQTYFSEAAREVRNSVPMHIIIMYIWKHQTCKNTSTHLTKIKKGKRKLEQHETLINDRQNLVFGKIKFLKAT